MKQSLLTQLRDRNTSMVEFKRASDKLAAIIVEEIAEDIVHSSPEVVLIPILRAGVALLLPFLRFFEGARVGFIGIHRDEQAVPHLYYEKIPRLTKQNRIIILDPMIASGGSTVLTPKKLVQAGGDPQLMTIVGMVGAPEGIEHIRSEFPDVIVKLATVDQGLDEKKYIVPGLGDFGDRFFGC